MKKSANKTVSSEVLAAFLDGNATAQESRRVLQAITEDAELRELLSISRSVDMELGFDASEIEYLPVTALAANCSKENQCCLECEKYILRKLGIIVDEDRLLRESVRNGWQKEEGTALHNIGRHLESHGLVVTRQFKCSIKDITAALDAGSHVIVAVDGGELTGDPIAELQEDVLFGQIPDHTVVVLSCDVEEGTITLFDPDSPNAEDQYSIVRFADAWNDSKNYLATITTKDMNTYNPKPIDLSDVELTEDLNELREAIAENAHDVWAAERQAQGWTYGPHRDDDKKETPCMLPYSQLPDSEKKFDRDMAMNTLKLVKKLGYDLIKREETELYQVLKKRIQDSEEEFFCRKCGHPIYKHQVFCDNCGLKLDMDW